MSEYRRLIGSRAIDYISPDNVISIAQQHSDELRSYGYEYSDALIVIYVLHWKAPDGSTGHGSSLPFQLIKDHCREDDKGYIYWVERIEDVD